MQWYMSLFLRFEEIKCYHEVLYMYFLPECDNTDEFACFKLSLLFHFLNLK